MNLIESIKVAWGGLAGNKLRSALTMLGVIVGVAAVIALVAIGQGASRQITAQIQGLGSNVIVIMPRSNTAARLQLSDVASLLQRVPTLTAAVPDLSRSGTVKWGNHTYDTTIEGTAPAFTTVRNSPVGAGRFLIPDDLTYRRRVAVVGYKLYTDLFGEHDPVGEHILIAGQSFTVVGVMAEKGQGITGDADDRVLIPITTAQRLLLTNRIGSIYAQVSDAGSAAATVAQITAIYERKFPTTAPGQNEAMTVFSQDQILSTVNQAMATFTIMLGAIAGVSLIVGGIGIMNIMLVSVTERTREIGIRKAIGARSTDILSQFLIESVVLSLSGGVVGVAVGFVLASAVKLAGLPAVVSLSSVLVAFAFATGVGLFFGIYPAMQAAQLDPIAALRHE